MNRGIRNAVAGFINQLLLMVVGIFVPRLLLLYFGSEVNGLISSITQIFTYFTILEAGVGAASLQSLYGSVAKNDYNSISGILSATNYYLKKTSVFYLISVVLFSIIYPIAVDSEISNTVITSLILIQGSVGVFNYLFYNKYIVLLQAEGKEYVILMFSTIVNICANILKISLILLNQNIVSVQLGFIIIGLLQIVLINIYIKHKYKWLNLKAEPDFKAISKKNSALVHQISYLIFNNTDILLLSLFCNLKIVSIYMMYYMFYGIINSVVYTAANSINFALGQTYSTDKELYCKMYNCYEVYFFVFIFTLYSITYMFILPFLKLYTLGVTDVNYIDRNISVLFLIVSLLFACRVPANNTINYAGHFKETRIKSIIESAINVVISIIGVYFFDIYGVMMGSVIALIYRLTDIIIYTNKFILKQSPLKTYKRLLICTILIFSLIKINSLINISLNSYVSIGVWGIVHIIAVGSIIFITMSAFNKEEYNFLLSVLKRFKKKKIVL